MIRPVPNNGSAICHNCNQFLRRHFSSGKCPFKFGNARIYSIQVHFDADKDAWYFAPTKKYSRLSLLLARLQECITK